MHHFGAHETMEAHEVLTSAVDTLNVFNFLRREITDPQLSQIMDRQINFMEKEYNDMVSYVSQHRGVTPDIYHSRRNASVNYGLRKPSPVAPHGESRQLKDRDAASIMLGMLKCSASKKMMAALECADSQLRRMMIQGANSCAEQAYEIFTFMNQRGMYQVPTMQRSTQENFMNMYQQAGTTTGFMPATTMGNRGVNLDNIGYIS